MFKLGRFSSGGSDRFTGIVIDDVVVNLSDAARAAPQVRFRGAELNGSQTIEDLLENWDDAFAALTETANALRARPVTEGVSAADRGSLRTLAPLTRPSKILCAAANFRGHVNEMRNSGYGGEIDRKKDFMGEKSRARPYLFLKAPSSICGPFDDVELPGPDDQVDWEIELAMVIGRSARNVPVERARDYIAGYMVSNDISCRNMLWREDRQTIRSDWLASKSHDAFCPIGPYFVPRDFIADHNNLHLSLKLNGESMQNGNTSEMIFSPDEQIEYTSKMMTLLPGDIFLTGTIAGVGQGLGRFLKPGDLIEAEIEGLGTQKNRVSLRTSAE